MAQFLKNYGLDFIMDNEETFFNFIGLLAQEGKAKKTYSGSPYLYKSLGHVEFTVNTELNHKEKKLSFKGFSTHCGNTCLWEMKYTGIDITPKDVQPHEKYAMFEPCSGERGFLPVDIINSDVLPGMLKGDKIKMQVVALPLVIRYYSDEEAYENDQPEYEDGKKYLVANGSMLSLAFLKNHSTANYDSENEYTDDLYVHFTATVKRLSIGSVEFGDDKSEAFIRCFADTNYGEIEFDHTFEQVPEEFHNNIKVGAVINGVCVISADVAILEYEDGSVKDLDNNLQLLRYTIEDGESERLEYVLAPDAVYETDSYNIEYVGRQKIIDRFEYVKENRKNKYFTHNATITSVDDENAEYPVGTRCVVLASEEENNYESILFITVDENGMITKIKISTDERYHFRIEKSASDDFSDIDFPDNVYQLILNRAKYHNLADDDLTYNDIMEDNNECLADDYFELQQRALNIFDFLKENQHDYNNQTMKNIFGYMFAKSAELAYFSDNKDCTDEIDVSDAINGVLNSCLSDEKHFVLENAMKIASQFYRDFEVFATYRITDESEYNITLANALVFVQKLGQNYSKRCFDNIEK